MEKMIVQLNTIEKLTEENKVFRAALVEIVADFIPEGHKQQCRDCEYDGLTYTKHWDNCVYALAKKALFPKSSQPTEKDEESGNPS